MALSPFEPCPPFWTGGPDPCGHYDFPSRSGLKGSAGMNASSKGGARTRSQYPVTTGTSVFGIRYKDGVVLAADTMGSYGSLARYPDMQRIHRINDTTVVGYGGDVADFQYLLNVIERRQVEEDVHGGGVNLRPESLHCWLTRVLYNRRSKFDPLWNTLVVAGMQKDKPFLGVVDMLGTAWQEDIIATGLGAGLAIPTITEDLEKLGGQENLTEEKAKELLAKCIEVSYLRDCRATSTYHLATINSSGSKVEGPLRVAGRWELARSIQGYS